MGKELFLVLAHSINITIIFDLTSFNRFYLLSGVECFETALQVTNTYPTNLQKDQEKSQEKGFQVKRINYNNGLLSAVEDGQTTGGTAAISPGRVHQSFGVL